jgi:hypothetical protein
MGSSTPMAAKVVSKPRHEKPLLFPFYTLIGKLLYCSNCTRPDIIALVNHLNMYMSNCTVHQWDQAKRVLLRHLNGTRAFCFTFNGNISLEAIMWQALSYGDEENMRSRTESLGMMCGG